MKYSQYSFLNQKKPETLTASCRCTSETANSLTDKLNLCNIETEERQLLQGKRHRLREIPNNEPSLQQVTRGTRMILRVLIMETISEQTWKNIFCIQKSYLLFVINKNSKFPWDSNSNINLSYPIMSSDKSFIFIFLYYSK